MKKRTVFLDRDGVINEDSPDYILSIDEFSFIEGSPEAILKLNQAGFDVFLITNQSVISRGMLKREELDAIFQYMKDGLASYGASLKDIFYCPHKPEDRCNCRKPEPGLFFQAQRLYGMNFSESIMVGDSAKDIEAALAAGIKNSILVSTGNGKKDLPLLEKSGKLPDFAAKNLYEAVEYILEGKLDF